MAESESQVSGPTSPGRAAESLKTHLVRGVLGAGGLGVVQKALSVLTAVLLARTMGVHNYGYYTFALAVVGFVAIPCQLGLPQLLTREVVAAHVREEWAVMCGLRRRAVQLSALAVAVSVIVVGTVLLAYADQVASLDRTTFALALALLPVLVGLSVANSLLRGLRRVVHAIWPGAAVQPALFLVGLMAFVSMSDLELKPPIVVMLNIGSYAIAFFVSAYLLQRYWPLAATKIRPSYATKKWIKSLLPFTMLAGINIVNQKTDILMLGFLTTPENVGIYNVVMQGGMLVSFSLAVFNSVLSPNVSRLYALQDYRALQRLMTLSTVGMLAVSVPTLLVFVFAGEWILGNIFGHEFTPGYVPLVIFGVGQLVSVSVGSVGVFLSMTGHEHDTLRAVAISAVVNVILNAILIPLYGVLGAATATATSTILWNIILAVNVHRRLGVIPGPYFRLEFRST